MSRKLLILKNLVPKGGLEPPRVTSHAPQTCASTNSATSACLGRSFYFEGSGDGVMTEPVGTANGAAGVGTGVGVATGAWSEKPDCNTEVVPLINGSDKHNATSINAAAAPIVSLASSVC